jgi:subtilisin family serine protease
MSVIDLTATMKLVLSLLLFVAVCKVTGVDLPHSPVSPADGFFIFMKPYAAEVYCDAPAIFLAQLSEYESFQSAAELNMLTMNKAERRSLVYSYRKAIADFTQREVRALLTSTLGIQESSLRSFWINNALFVKGQPLDVKAVGVLQEHPHVAHIRENRVIASVIQPEELVEVDNARAVYAATEEPKLPWNLEILNIEEAWNITRGAGVVVANIDTGVRATHMALRSNYRGSDANAGRLRLQSSGASRSNPHDYNWYDPKEFANDEWWCTPGICSPSYCCELNPFDNIGHGTHCMASSVGSELLLAKSTEAEESGMAARVSVGVAPGASWIAAKGCKDGQCMAFGLTASAEWVVCPTRVGGSEPNCALGADIVSNSWGGGHGDTWYADYVQTWIEAGMIPIFATGNNGPKCSTTSSPGRVTATLVNSDQCF